MKFTVTLIFICSFTVLFGQTITKATKVYRYAPSNKIEKVNYDVTVELKTSPKTIKIVNVWLGNSISLSANIVPVISSTNQFYVSFESEEGVSPKNRRDHLDATTQKSISDEPTIPTSYEGEALLILEIDGDRVEIIIEKFEEVQICIH